MAKSAEQRAQAVATPILEAGSAILASAAVPVIGGIVELAWSAFHASENIVLDKEKNNHFPEGAKFLFLGFPASVALMTGHLELAIGFVVLEQLIQATTRIVRRRRGK